MTTHLQGRMPHGDITAFMERVYKLQAPHKESKADKEGIANQLAAEIGHIARTFVQVVADFRSTLPRSEEKQLLRHKQQKKNGIEKHKGTTVPSRKPQPQPDTWWPFENAFDEVETRSVEVDVGRGPPLVYFKGTIEDSSYRPEWSAACSLIVHNRLEPFRKMADSGVDLRLFHHQLGHVAGGLMYMIYDNVPLYLWINQLLSHGYSLPTRQDKLRERDQHQKLLNKQKVSLKSLIVDNVCKSLQNAAIDHDCTEFRQHRHIQHLREYVLQHIWHNLYEEDDDSIKPPPKSEELYEYIKSHAFPQLCRTSHIYLYNKVRREQQQTSENDETVMMARLENSEERTFFDSEIQENVIDMLRFIVEECQPCLKKPLHEALEDKRLLTPVD